MFISMTLNSHQQVYNFHEKNSKDSGFIPNLGESALWKNSFRSGRGEKIPWSVCFNYTSADSFCLVGLSLLWLNFIDISFYDLNVFYVFSTVQHSKDLFHLQTLMHNSFIH